MFFFKKFRHKNVILISIDTLRFDCVGYQPDKKELHKYNVAQLLETPTLDKLSENALCFTQCISTNTYTTSAHASVFTGLYPPHHGVRAFFDTKLSKNVKTLAEIFKENGYITILATDVMALFKPLDLTRGFDYLFERNDGGLLKLLEKHKKENIFLFMHFFDIHEPYLFCETPINSDYNKDYFELMDVLYKQHNIEIKDRKPHALWSIFSNGIGKNVEHLLPVYIKGVNKFDNGRFRMIIENLERIKFFEGSLSIIFSDHGEGKCDHHNPQIFSHGADLYDNVLRIPLLVIDRDLRFSTDDRLLSICDIFTIIIEYTSLDFRSEYNLDAVNLNKNRTSTFCERWISPVIAYLSEDEHGNPVIPHQYIMNNEWLVSQRSIRTNDEKFIIRAKQEDLTNLNNENLDDEQFVKILYRKVLGRWEEPDGLKHHVMTLKNKLTTRKKKLTEFLSSEEAKNNLSFFRFDLKEDPYEEMPLSPGNDINTLRRFGRMFDIILEIENKAVSTEKIFNNWQIDTKQDDEKTKIIKKLKELGYF